MLQHLTEARKIAEAFVAARQARQALIDYPGQKPQSLDDAYAIQDTAISLVDADIAGWKVGRINPPLSETLGLTRLAGPIFAGTVQTLSDLEAPTGYIFRDGFGAAEAEFVFRIGSELPGDKTTYTTEEARELIDAVFCGFEIASSPFPDINSSGPLVTISDFGNNHGELMGPEIPNWKEAGIDNWKVETRIDGIVVGSGSASAFPGGPIESVRFLLENLAARGIAVPAGTLISTGAITGVHEVTAGQQVETRFADFCTLNCAIEYATT